MDERVTRERRTLRSLEQHRERTLEPGRRGDARAEECSGISGDVSPSEPLLVGEVRQIALDGRCGELAQRSEHSVYVPVLPRRPPARRRIHVLEHTQRLVSVLEAEQLRHEGTVNTSVDVLLLAHPLRMRIDARDLEEGTATVGEAHAPVLGDRVPAADDAFPGRSLAIE